MAHREFARSMTHITTRHSCVIPDGNKIDFVLRGRLKQMRIRHLPAVAANSNAPRPAEYHWLFWAWFWFGFPAFSALLAIFQSE
jgi:hypothetical protein